MRSPAAPVNQRTAGAAQTGEQDVGRHLFIGGTTVLQGFVQLGKRVVTGAQHQFTAAREVQARVATVRPPQQTVLDQAGDQGGAVVLF